LDKERDRFHDIRGSTVEIAQAEGLRLVGQVAEEEDRIKERTLAQNFRVQGWLFTKGNQCWWRG